MFCLSLSFSFFFFLLCFVLFCGGVVETLLLGRLQSVVYLGKHDRYFLKGIVYSYKWLHSMSWPAKQALS